MKKRKMLIGAALICTTIATVGLAQRGTTQTASGFAGEYGGTSDGGKAIATIQQASPGNYTIEHTIIGTRDGCGGSVRGAASASGNILELRIPNIEAMETCVMTYRKNGNSLAVSEKSCGYYHGRSCAFDGALIRKAGTASQQSLPKARTRTAEPLFGLTESGGPAGGDLVTPTRSPKVSSFSNEWYAADDFVAVDDGEKLGLTLIAICDGSPLRPMISVNATALIRGLNIPDFDAFAKRERNRLFARAPTLALTILDGAGVKSGMMTFGRTMRDGAPTFNRPLSQRELALLKASSRIALSSETWMTYFTGNGATRMLSALRC